MTNGIAKKYQLWHLADLLRDYDKIRPLPASGGESTLVLGGEMPFQVKGPDEKEISDQYAVEILVPSDFPQSLPLVRETAGRIPKEHHKLTGDFLCLATPTEQRLVLAQSPTLPGFVRHLLLPYLFSYSYYEKHGEMPYGEEEHGNQGIRDQLGRFFNAPAVDGIEEFLRLTSLRKRSANKRPCPCRSGRRLGRCHNRQVNHRRRQLGRQWFRKEHSLIDALLNKRVSSQHQRMTKPPTLREKRAHSSTPPRYNSFA